MCSIAKNLTGSIASQAANSTMLGGAAVGSSTLGPGAKRVAGGLASTMLGSGGGGAGPETGSSGGNPRNPKLPLMMQE